MYEKGYIGMRDKKKQERHSRSRVFFVGYAV